MDRQTQAALQKAMEKLEANPLRSATELFVAALDEFSGKSYDDASLNGIIKAAGMNKGSFYYRFKNKLALYLAVFEEIGRQKIEFFATKKEIFETPPEDIFDQFAMMQRAGLEFARHEPRYYKFWRRFIAESTAFRQVVKEAFPESGIDILEEIIDRAIAQGQFRPELAPGLIKKVALLLLYNSDNLVEADCSDEELLGQLDNLNEIMRRGISRQSDGVRVG